ncbi:MAG: hypothetical protein Q8L05_12235 [Actinomycetota bacterium]|nr:hypothetical protein [Actinomycetota bacterium]MDP2288020.1 hypothetical protein [Actinomycetota bacterium]
MAGEESVMSESPQEFLQEATPGYCDVQSFVPVEGGYAGHCTCGGWDVVMPTQEEAHALAVEHTMAITLKELAKRGAQASAPA